LNRADWNDLWCRKALSTMPAVVWFKFYCLWNDLWCRKALSTNHLLRQWSVRCYPEMIFDAERRWAHTGGHIDQQSLGLKWSLMPKGVEHLFQKG